MTRYKYGRISLNCLRLFYWWFWSAIGRKILAMPFQESTKWAAWNSISAQARKDG